MSNQAQQNYKSYKAKEFEVNQWIDANGNKTELIKLSDLNGKFKVLFCFQSWCPGCHKKGFPNLKKMVEAFQDNDKVVFLAVQTVFEGHHENTYEKILEMQKQYDLKIPFGHDVGNEGTNISNMMINYQTGGTPWFIFIDTHDKVVFSDFHLNPDAAIDLLKAI